MSVLLRNKEVIEFMFWVRKTECHINEVVVYDGTNIHIQIRITISLDG